MGIKWDETKIQERLRRNYDHEYQLTNSFVFAWESDYFGISRSGYIYEVEIKTSISDFRADFGKTDKHNCLKNAKAEFITLQTEEKQERVHAGFDESRRGRFPIWEYKGAGYCPLRIRKNTFVPNRFLYCVPEEIFQKASELVPKYAGLIYIKENGTLVPVKAAPWLHKRKLKEDLTTVLLKKFYHLSLKQRMDIFKLEDELHRANKEWYYPILT